MSRNNNISNRITPLFNLKLTESGAIANVKENEFILKEIEKAPELNPRELLSMAAQYRRIPALFILAHKLGLHAIREIVLSKSVQRAVKKIAKEEVEWSIFSDIWDAIVGFVTGEPKEAPKDPFADAPGCKFKCVLGLLLFEKCPSEKNWRLIGICMSGKV